MPYLTAPVKAGDIAGKVSVYAYDQKVAETDLVITESREESFLGKLDTFLLDLSAGNIWVVSLFLIFLLLVLVCIALILSLRRTMKRRKKKRLNNDLPQTK